MHQDSAKRRSYKPSLDTKGMGISVYRASYRVTRVPAPLHRRLCALVRVLREKERVHACTLARMCYAQLGSRYIER